MKNPFEFLKHEPKKDERPDRVINNEEYLKSLTNPANEHHALLIEDKAKKEGHFTAEGDRIEKLVAEDGSVLEYVNVSEIQKIKQEKQRKEMVRAQAQAREKEHQEKLANN